MAMDSGAGDCIRCCCSFILTSGLTALFLWLSLRTNAPSFSIQRFDIPPLNLSAGAAARNNRTIDFDLELRNSMKDKGVCYGNISLAFSYRSVVNGSAVPIANFTVPAFYQGHGKKARRRNLIAINGSVPWAAAMDAVRKGSTVTFRVDLRTRVKFKILFWYTKRHGLAVGENVEINDSGGKARKKIKLKSGAPNLDSGSKGNGEERLPERTSRAKGDRAGVDRKNCR